MNSTSFLIYAIGLGALVTAAFGGPRDIPVRPGSTVTVLPASIAADARLRVFASTVTPDGVITGSTELYSSVQGLIMPVIRPVTHFSDTGGSLPPKGVLTATMARDGLSAAYAVQPAQAGPEQVRVINPDNGADRTIYTDQAGCAPAPNQSQPCLYALHFTADGKQVLYAANRSQSLGVIPVDGGAAVTLPVKSAEVAPSWQRVISQADTVVFTSADPAGGTSGAANVYVINLDGTDLRALTSFAANSNVITQNATISADGSLVAFTSNYGGSPDAPNGNSRIYVVHTDGTGLRPVTNGANPAGWPTLSRDGSVLLYVQENAIWKASPTFGDRPPVLVQKYAASALQTPVLAEDGESYVATLGPSSGVGGRIDWFATDGGLKSNVYAPGLIVPDGIRSAGLGTPAAGSLISVYGLNLGYLDQVVAADQMPLPTTLERVSLLVNDEPIPVLAVTPWQINAQLPFEFADETVTIKLAINGTATTTTLLVPKVAPALFTVAALAPSGVSYAQTAALHAGSSRLADAAAPASPGEELELYATGLGATTPAIPAGVASPANPPAVLAETPQVRIGGLPASVSFAGLAPGLVGVYQVNVTVPTGLSSGLQTVTVEEGGSTSLAGEIVVS